MRPPAVLLTTLCAFSACTSDAPGPEPATADVGFHCFKSPAEFSAVWPEQDAGPRSVEDSTILLTSPSNSHCERVSGLFREGFLADMGGACAAPGSSGGGTVARDDGARDSGVAAISDASLDGGAADASVMNDRTADFPDLRLGLARYLVLVNVPDVSRIIARQVAVTEPGSERVEIGPVSGDELAFPCSEQNAGGEVRVALRGLVASAELRGTTPEDERLNVLPQTVGYRTRYAFSQCGITGAGAPGFSSEFSVVLTGEGRATQEPAGPLQVELLGLVSTRLRLFGERELEAVTDCEPASVNVSFRPQLERIEPVRGGVCLGAIPESASRGECEDLDGEWFSAERLFDGWR